MIMVRTDHPFLRVGRHRVNISRRWQRGGGQHFALLGWGRWFHEECGLGLGKDKSRARKRASQEMVNRSGWGDILNLLFLGAALAGDGGDGGGRCGVKKGRWHWGERSEMKMRRERGGLALEGGRGRNNISLHRRRVKMQIAHYLIRSILHVLYAYSIRDGISLYLIRSILHVLYAYSIRDGIFPCYTKQHCKIHMHAQMYSPLGSAIIYENI
jgi:hypothetical protein